MPNTSHMTFTQAATGRLLARFAVAMTLSLGLASMGSDAALAQDKKDAQDPPAWSATSIEQTLSFDGQTMPYTASALEVPLTSDDGKWQATMHAFSYTKGVDGSNKKTASQTEDQDPAKRPLVFLFNGGPGSSSVWLHLGAFGPNRVTIDDEGIAQGPPFGLVPNPNTLLTDADLVFVDPITTGQSRPAEGVDGNRMYRSVSGDLRSIGQFIYKYLNHEQRWGSPIYLIGESYGTTRVSGLVQHLQNEHGIYANGVVLVSSILDFSMIQYGPMNDHAFAGILPTYAAIAHHHGKAGKGQTLDEHVRKAEAFVEATYWPALLQAVPMDPAKREAIAQTMAKLIGIDANLLVDCQLRLHPSRFRAELLKDQPAVIGRFDGRYNLPDAEPDSPYPGLDPSYSLVHGAFTAGIHQWMGELGYENDTPYTILKGGNWDWESEGRSLQTASRLADALNASPQLKVFVASGLYDLATPHFAARMTINRYITEPDARSRVTFMDFPAGHMMFVHKDSQTKLVQALRAWLAVPDAAQ